MSCLQIDWKAYVLGELAESERRQAEEHKRSCAVCREEVERLHATRSALLSLPQEEIPRRISFVSDKVFEPRWWQRLWRSGPQLGFASAAMVAAAILVHAFAGPASGPPAVRPMDTAAFEARLQSEVSRLVQAASEKTAAESDARHERQTTELIRALESRFEKQRQADLLAVEENMNMLRKRWGVIYTASAEMGGPR